MTSGKVFQIQTLYICTFTSFISLSLRHRSFEMQRLLPGNPDPGYSLGEMEIGGQLGSIIRNMLVHNWGDEDLNELSVTRTEEMSCKKIKDINVFSEYQVPAGFTPDPTP